MIEKIETIICLGEGVTPKAIHCKSRSNELKETRQIIIFFAREMTRGTLKSISGYFGLDHATAFHACKTISNLIDTDKKFCRKMKRYRLILFGINLNPKSSDKDIISRLENELYGIETKLTTLKQKAELIISEIENISVSIKSKPIIESKKDIKPQAEPVKIEFDKRPVRNPVYASLISCNNREMHGYREHCL